MPDTDKRTGGKAVQPSSLDEARRLIADYAAELREIIRKLRRKPN